MIVMGIDPGLINTGFGIISFANNEVSTIDFGIISPDVNDDLSHDILDIVTTVNIILAGGVGSGEFTACEEADADMDSNGVVNILDVIVLINMILDR